MVSTENLRKIIRNKEVNITRLAKETGIPYMCLYDSLKSMHRNRELRADELLKVCACLGIDPRRLLNK